MRVGILTLHDSVNYGALAQAFALRSYLTSRGHEAFVVDRRRDPSGVDVRTPPRASKTFRAFGLFTCDAANGERANDLRLARTRAFLKDRVGLSEYAFSSWSDAPRELGLDALVVGSDQVWNANNLNPEDYLLKGVPEKVAGIAYAASIGMASIPENWAPVYRDGLARFRALSVREREAADLVRGLGFAAEHVVDPVLLAGASAWDAVRAGGGGRGGDVFAYFLAEDAQALFAPLGAFARSRGTRVSYFADWFSLGRTKGLRRRWRNLKRLRAWESSGVDLRSDAGPEEFVRAIASAEVVVTNSYHALMFGILFGKEVRVVLPTHPVRRAMNARLREFEGTLVDGPLVHETLASALASLARGERCQVCADELARRVAASRAWLDRSLEGTVA